MLKATIDEKKSHEIDIKSGKTLVNNEQFSYELSQLNDRLFHVLHQHQSYNVEVLKADYQRKEFLLKINGKKHHVKLQDRFDQLIAALGMEEDAADAAREIVAPMPGLILKIHVNAGDEVKKNDPLITLEAMKMENVLKSPGEGKVEEVIVKQGDSVEKSQLMIRLA
ncbi:MAG: biotin/lipoyl-containing protein [Cyclobacteriaceae bacterium]